MKKSKFLTLIVVSAFGCSVSHPPAKVEISFKDKLSPQGYWIQFDEDENAGQGIAQGVVHTYFAKNNKYGKKGTLEAQIVVPLMYINENGEPAKPRLTCNDCSDGSYNGFNYKGKDAKLQNLVFAANMQKQEATAKPPSKGFIYKNGGVINPNNGQVYSCEAQVQDGGDTMYAKASYVLLGKELGKKDAHWKRISKEDYQKIKSDCGLTSQGQYLNKNIKITEKCVNYPVAQFGIKRPI